MASRHTVRIGDCVASIAFHYGFFPDTIWDHPENASLRERRNDPNVLLEGDVVFIPDKELKTESVALDQRHAFRRRGVPERFRVRFALDGAPRANAAYRVEFDIGASKAGVTGANGEIDVGISPSVRRATVTFETEPSRYEFDVGGLDPIDTVRGQRGRLRAGGFYEGALDGERDDSLTAAIERFQRAEGLEPTGEPDATTLARLDAAFGS